MILKIKKEYQIRGTVGIIKTKNKHLLIHTVSINIFATGYKIIAKNKNNDPFFYS